MDIRLLLLLFENLPPPSNCFWSPAANTSRQFDVSQWWKQNKNI